MSTALTIRQATTHALNVEKARALLAKANKIGEVREIAAKASAILTYLKRTHNSSIGAQNDAAEIQIRAEIRMGELTAAMKKDAGGRPKTGNKSLPVLKQDALAAEGITKMQASRYEELARLPKREVERALKQARQNGERIGRSRLAPVIKERNRRENEQRLRKQSKGNRALPKNRLYSVIYADPPWEFEHEVTPSRSLDRQYPQMSLDKICHLKIAKLTTSDAMLFLWVPSSKLDEGLRVVRAWGFDYRTNIVWDKGRPGMGYYCRQRHEHLLIAAKGKPITPPTKARPDSIIPAPRGRHSAKPDVFYEIIEKMYPNLERVELFARKKRAEWDAWGNEA